MATVVVTLFGVTVRSSTPMLASVMTASVVSGTISDTEPTRVVLPTPNPPATTIFAEVVGCGAGPRVPRGLEPAETTEHPFHEIDRGPVADDRAALVDQDEPHPGHVTDQHPGRTERQLQVDGYLRDGPGFHAQVTDRTVLLSH